MRVRLIMILMIMPLWTLGQRVDGGIGVSILKTLSERWSLMCGANTSVTSVEGGCVWSRVGVGGRFAVLDSLHVFMTLDYTDGEYVEIENADRMFTLAEGAMLTMRNGVSQTLLFNQRKLYYRPSDINATCTRVVYKIGKDIRIKQSRWGLEPSLQVAANIKSDVEGSAFLQRVKCGVAFGREMTESVRLAMKYEYMVGGKKQPYVGEMHNMHRVSVFCYIGK